jgi:hypothetical protein
MTTRIGGEVIFSAISGLRRPQANLPWVGYVSHQDRGYDRLPAP